jgi:hypothetical protein
MCQCGWLTDVVVWLCCFYPSVSRSVGQSVGCLCCSGVCFVAFVQWGYRFGWLNLFCEIDNQPDQPTTTPREPTKSNVDSSTRTTLVGLSVGPYNQVNEFSQIFDWTKWLIVWLKNQQRQPLEKPNQERGNYPINQGYWFEHPLNLGCLLKSTIHVNSSINQVYQSKQHSVKQVNQYNQPSDS